MAFTLTMTMTMALTWTRTRSWNMMDMLRPVLIRGNYTNCSNSVPAIAIGIVNNLMPTSDVVVVDLVLDWIALLVNKDSRVV